MNSDSLIKGWKQEISDMKKLVLYQYGMGRQILRRLELEIANLEKALPEALRGEADKCPVAKIFGKNIDSLSREDLKRCIALIAYRDREGAEALASPPQKV